MKIIKTVIALVLGGFVLISCVSPPKPPPDSEITSLAREKVIKELRSLDAASLAQIQAQKPAIKWNTIDWYLDYEISWQVISNRSVVVNGTWSDREKLKYSRIQVRPTIQ